MRIKWRGVRAGKPVRSPLAAHVGKQIHELRQEHQVSMRALADATGLSVAFVCQVENGQSAPTIETLYRVATYFHVSVGLFTDSYEPTTKKRSHAGGGSGR